MAIETCTPQPGGAEGRPEFRIRAEVVLLDIEGTISPVSFVRDTLFPYSKERISHYVSANADAPEVKDILSSASALAPDADGLTTLIGWHDRDIKAPPLKKLQGMIWESGYRSGELRSPIFPDAFEKLQKWNQGGLPLYIYSSGSIQAQKLFFEFNTDGDLRPLLSGYFDTEIGAKTEAQSYLRISQNIGASPAGIVFFSDNANELEAARSAGLQVVHVVKDGTEPHPGFPHATDYRQVEVTREENVRV
jgi:enolase-phosphatase E1